MVSVCAKADIVINSSLSLTNFQILPTAGTVQIFPSGLGVNGITGEIVGGDSAGGSFNETGPVPLSAATAFTSATATGSFPPLRLASTSNVDLPPNQSSAGSDADAIFTGDFEVTGVSNPVDVTFSASLNEKQFVSTLGRVQAAESRIEFLASVVIPSGIQVEVIDVVHDLVLPGGSSDSASLNSVVTGTLNVLPNVMYDFGASPYVVSTTSPQLAIPEPSFSVLVGSGLAMLIARSRSLFRRR